MWLLWCAHFIFEAEGRTKREREGELQQSSSSRDSKRSSTRQVVFLFCQLLVGVVKKSFARRKGAKVTLSPQLYMETEPLA